MGPSFHSDSFSLPVLILKFNFCAKLSNIQSPKNLPLATTVLKFTFNSESAKSQRQSFWSPEWCWSKFLFVLFTECNLRSPNLDGSFCASEALNLCFFHSIHIFDKYYREVLTYLSDPLIHHIPEIGTVSFLENCVQYIRTVMWIYIYIYLKSLTVVLNRAILFPALETRSGMRYLAMCGNIICCHSLGGYCCKHLVCRGQGSYYMSCNAQNAPLPPPPRNRERSSQNINSAEAKNINTTSYRLCINPLYL